MERHFEFTGKTKTKYGISLNQIKATVSFGAVVKEKSADG